MPNFRPFVPLVALGAALCLLPGCASHHAQTFRHAGNIFRVPILSSPTTFDPALVQDGTTIDMLQNVFEGLVQWSPKNQIVPCLAQKWDVSKDGLVYTFHLRPNVKFQDGSPVTAQDVYYSMHRALDPKLGSPVALDYLGDIAGAREEMAGKSADLAGVKVVDPQTVAITITKPKAYWIYTLTYPTAYVVSKAEADAAGGPMTDADVAKGAGTGPFRVASYQKDFKVSLAANPAYWDGAPRIAGIERPIIKDAGTRHAEYVHGNLDLLQYETQGDLQADKNDPKLKNQVQFFPRAATFYVGLNQKAFAPFKDVRVRQAFAYATDKEKIRTVALLGINDTAQDLLPEGLPGYDPNFKGLPYDPARARQLLAQAGYPGGKGFPTIPMTYRESYPDLAKTVDLLRGMWQQNLGVTVQPKQTEWGAMLQREDANVLECYHIRWAADYLDPQDYYSLLLRTGSVEDHTVYSNPKFDALCDAADVEQDKAKRFSLYRQAARIAADEAPIIPLYYQKDIELVRPNVKNMDDSLMGHLPYKHLTLTP